MKINYNVTGAERKALVSTISQELNITAKYLGMPTAAYKVGEYIIDKNGTLTGMDNLSLEDALCQKGFEAAEREYDELLAHAAEIEEQPDSEDANFTKRSDDATELEKFSQNPDRLVIELPKDGFTGVGFANLEKLIESKSALIKKAIGAENLSIEQTAETLRFPWFSFEATAEEVSAYTRLIAALCNMAKEQKRITAKEKPVDNDKYAFRCFLLRLGFIGNDYKSDRKILLSKLSGNGSFKNKPKPKQQQQLYTLRCLHCNFEFSGTIETDNLGTHSSCPECGSSFDVDLEAQSDE